MHPSLRVAIAIGLSAAFAIPSARAAVGWNQDLRQQEMLALIDMKPVIVIFMGNGKWDASIFSREPVDKLGAKANYAWVGPI